MRLIQIKVKSGGRFPHPHETFSNLEVEIELTAEIRPDEDEAHAIRELQIAADTAYAQHRQQRLDTIEVLHKALYADRRSLVKEEIDVPF